MNIFNRELFNRLDILGDVRERYDPGLRKVTPENGRKEP